MTDAPARDGAAVLGIDAAWTDSQPSGVALIVRRRGRWFCLRSASSYRDFTAGRGTSRRTGSQIEVAALLRAAQLLLAGTRPGLIAVDMPIGRQRITGRRAADDQVSTRFGHAKCPVHSPSAQRPGSVGVRLVRGFVRAGFALRFSANSAPIAGSLIEVYPHVALLALMRRTQRLPYKCGKTNLYWRSATLAERRHNLLEQWRSIEARLRKHIDGIDVGLPPPDYDGPLSHLKAHEDRLDALICAWVGALCLDGKALPLGDADSAIWVPSAAMEYAKQT